MLFENESAIILSVVNTVMTRSSIEAVITSTTGNRVTVISRPRVRISPAPPIKKSAYADFFIGGHICDYFSVSSASQSVTASESERQEITLILSPRYQLFAAFSPTTAGFSLLFVYAKPCKNNQNYTEKCVVKCVVKCELSE